MRRYLWFFVCFVMLLSCFFGKTLVMAQEEEKHDPMTRYYTTVEVEEGDSLWKIAERYNKNSGMDTRVYVRELKAMNRLSCDRIDAGDCLLVMYFE